MSRTMAVSASSSRRVVESSRKDFKGSSAVTEGQKVLRGSSLRPGDKQATGAAPTEPTTKNRHAGGCSGLPRLVVS